MSWSWPLLKGIPCSVLPGRGIPIDRLPAAAHPRLFDARCFASAHTFLRLTNRNKHWKQICKERLRSTLAFAVFCAPASEGEEKGQRLSRCQYIHRRSAWKFGRPPGRVQLLLQIRFLPANIPSSPRANVARIAIDVSATPRPRVHRIANPRLRCRARKFHCERTTNSIARHASWQPSKMYELLDARTQSHGWRATDELRYDYQSSTWHTASRDPSP